MFATFALMTHSLRTHARELRTHAFRVAAVLAIYLAVLQAFSSSGSVGAPGLAFLVSMAYLNVVLITVAGPSVFATLLTEERAEKTLGLLTLAGVNALSMLAGRLVPALLTSILLLTVQFPFTLLAITLGGVTWHQVVAIYASLLAFLIFTATVGLLFSVICQRSGTASALTIVVLLVSHLLPFLFPRPVPVPGSTFMQLVMSGVPEELSMFGRVGAITETGFAESALSVQVLVHGVAALLCFGVSWAALARILRTSSDIDAEPAQATSVRGRRRLLGPGRAWSRPIVWKDFYFIAGGPLWWAVKLVLYPLIVWGVYEFLGGTMGSNSAVSMLTPTMLVALLFESAIYASRVFRVEVQDKTYSTLAILPQWTGSIMYAKIAGCALGLLPAVLWAAVGLFDWLELVSSGYALFYVGLAVSYGAFFCYLVAYLSLVVRHGALPLALAIVWATTCAFPLCLVGIFILDAKIHERLEGAAAE